MPTVSLGLRCKADSDRDSAPTAHPTTMFCVTPRAAISHVPKSFAASEPYAQADPNILLSLQRPHWHIENKSHGIRDIVLDEDYSQVRCSSIPQVMAARRSTGIGLLRLHGKHQIAAAFRRHAGRPAEALEFLGIPKTE